MIEVSAGIIRNPNGQILVCKRGPGRLNAHLWEFPGGKREPGEDAGTCLMRELKEELALPISDLHVCHIADEGEIRFTFLTGRTDATPVPTEHEDVRFLNACELLKLTFCPADTPVALALALNEPPVTDFFWDYDGTLFDTYPIMKKAFSKACAIQDADVSEEEALSWMKQSLTDAVQVASERFPIDTAKLLRDFRSLEAEIPLNELPMLPGMEECLKSLSEMGCRHFLVTHRNSKALDALEAKGLLRLFTGWVTQEDGFPRKPDPTSLLHLIKQYNVDPECACMIGDRPLDVRAGQNAGMLSCLLDTEGRFAGEPCDIRAASAEGLAGMLRPDPIKPIEST